MKKKNSILLITLLLILLCSFSYIHRTTSHLIKLDEKGNMSQSTSVPKAELLPSSLSFVENKQDASLLEHEQDLDKKAISMIEKLSLDMWNPYITLTPFTIPEYVENNAHTHLAMRWVDYHQAEIKKYPHRQLVSIDSVDVSIQESDETEDGLLKVRGMSEIRYTRLEPSVNGMNVEFDLLIDLSTEDWKIVSIDMVFNSIYSSMKEKIEGQTEVAEPTIQTIDDIVDEAIKNL